MKKRRNSTAPSGLDDIRRVGGAAVTSMQQLRAMTLRAIDAGDIEKQNLGIELMRRAGRESKLLAAKLRLISSDQSRPQSVRLEISPEDVEQDANLVMLLLSDLRNCLTALIEQGEDASRVYPVIERMEEELRAMPARNKTL